MREYKNEWLEGLDINYSDRTVRLIQESSQYKKCIERGMNPQQALTLVDRYHIYDEWWEQWIPVVDSEKYPNSTVYYNREDSPYIHEVYKKVRMKDRQGGGFVESVRGTGDAIAKIDTKYYEIPVEAAFYNGMYIVDNTDTYNDCELANTPDEPEDLVKRLVKYVENHPLHQQLMELGADIDILYVRYGYRKYVRGGQPYADITITYYFDDNPTRPKRKNIEYSYDALGDDYTF